MGERPACNAHGGLGDLYGIHVSPEHAHENHSCCWFQKNPGRIQRISIRSTGAGRWGAPPPGTSHGLILHPPPPPATHRGARSHPRANVPSTLHTPSPSLIPHLPMHDADDGSRSISEDATQPPQETRETQGLHQASGDGDSLQRPHHRFSPGSSNHCACVQRCPWLEAAWLEAARRPPRCRCMSRST